MSLQVKLLEDSDKSDYQAFLQQPDVQAHLTFFHTWEWGEFLSGHVRVLQRVGVYKDDMLVAVGQASLQGLRGGCFWYMPRGLVMNYDDQMMVATAYKAIADYFRTQANAAYLRVDPNIIRGDQAETALDTLKPRQAYIFTQAERIWMVDLQQDEISLLSWLKEHGMRKKLPYYLRKAQKAGVTVRASDKPEDLETLIAMLHQMSDRKGGVGMHSDDYYRRQFAVMAPAGYQKIFVAEKDNQVLAIALIGIYRGEGSYLHAASADAERELSAPHRLLFEVMNYLQDNKLAERFNFWGIVSDENRTANHPRNGYSEFKRSFGGYKLQYIRSRDFVYKPLVWQLAHQTDRYRTYKYKND